MNIEIVTRTKDGSHSFSHFIEISKANVEHDVKYFCEHLREWNEEVVSVRLVQNRLSNW